MNPNTKKPTSNVVAGQLGKVFVQSATSRMDMRAPVKGNAQGEAERKVSRIVPSKGARWGGYAKQVAGPPKSTNWRATSQPMPNKPVGKR